MKPGDIIVYTDTEDNRYFKEKEVVIRLASFDGVNWWVGGVMDKDLGLEWQSVSELCIGYSEEYEKPFKLANKKEIVKVIN